MALASASHGVGGGSKIAEKWRISADFDPIAGGPEAFSPGSETRADFPGAGIPASGARFAVRGARRWHPGQRGAVPGSRPAMPRPVSLGRAARGAARHVSLV